jgi:hypothetical protein
VSLIAVDALSRATTDAGYGFAPEDTLHYRATLSAPDGDHQIRLVAYREGTLIQDLTHSWRLPYGAHEWTAHAQLYPQGGWLPGEYSLHLWVNGLPWDVQSFTIVNLDPDNAGIDPSTLDAVGDPQTFLEAISASVHELPIEIVDESWDEDAQGALYVFSVPPASDVEALEHEILLDGVDAWLRSAGYARVRVGIDPMTDGMLSPDGRVRRYAQGDSQILTQLEEFVEGIPSQVSLLLLTPDDQEYLQGINTVPLTPESANALVVQALLEPVGGLDYIDMVYVDGGRALATLNLENELVVYDTATWRELYRYGTGVFGWNLTTDAAGSRLAIAYQDLTETGDHFPILVWDTASWGSPARLEGHGGTVTAMSFDPHGEWLITAALDQTVRVWSLQGEPATAFVNPGVQEGQYVVTALDVSPDGSRVAMTYSDGMAELYRLELVPGASRIPPLYPFEVGGQDIHLLRIFPAPAQQDPAVSVAFGAPQILVVAANEVQVWAYYDQVAEQVYALPERLGAAAFSSDAQLLVVGGGDSYIVDTISGEILAELDYGMIQHVDVSSTGQIALLDGAGNLYVLAPAE